MSHAWLGNGYIEDVILRPIEVTPEIEARLGPMRELGWPCGAYAEHAETEEKGCYEDDVLIAVTEYCSACGSIVRTRKVIGEDRAPDLSPLLQRRIGPGSGQR